MRVAEYPLSLIHWKLRQDPWVRAIFLAAGVPLDEAAERILDIAAFEDSEAMLARGLALWERILGLTPKEGASMEQRRRAVQAMWLASMPPSAASLRAVCDALRPGALGVGYDPQDPGAILLWYLAGGGYLPPEDMDEVLEALDRVKPAHLVYHYGLEPELQRLVAYGYPVTFYGDLEVTIRVPD